MPTARPTSPSLPFAESGSQPTKRHSPSPSRQAKMAGCPSTRPSTASAWRTKWTRLTALAPNKRSSLAPTLRRCCQRPRPLFIASLPAVRRSVTRSANWPTPATCAACASFSIATTPAIAVTVPSGGRSVCFHIVDKSRLAENLLAILRELSARYDFHLDGW